MNAEQTTGTEWAAWVGLDWGYAEHVIGLKPAGGGRETTHVDASPESFHRWIRALGDRFKGRPVAVAVEASRGAVINALLEHESWIHIFPINPATSSRYRKAFVPSGAKDDGPDAMVLLELVCEHMSKLRPLPKCDEQTKELLGLSELRRKLVDARSKLSNQLDGLLKSYYPQALSLIGDKTSPMAMDFLRRWPDLLRLKRARPSTLRSFYYKHNARSEKRIQERLERVEKAVALTSNETQVGLSVLHLKALIAQIEVLNEQICGLEKRIAGAFQMHPDKELFSNLPGVGSAMGPRLCAAFGVDRQLYPDRSDLQKLAGVAPVIEKSGNSSRTHWRWQAPKFLRQTFVEWAGLSVQYSSWAAEYYRQMQKKGKPRQTILRSLAFKWIRILWTCWRNNTPYDEAAYIKQLKRRGSPYAVATAS